jgi:glycosyltransferase involved in cell wall biosynthesis
VPQGSSERPLVSAIVPTYDHRAHLLQTALASIWGQEGLGELFDLEVIVADNASADPTADVIRRYPGTKHLQMGSNRGLWAALNRGLKEATGKYVAFLIDDDMWLPHKLRVQVPALESVEELTIAYSQHVYLTGDSVDVAPPGPQPSGDIFRDCLLQTTFLAEQAMLIPREAFDVAGYFDEDLESAAGDGDMWLRLAFHFPFKFVPGVVAVYVRSITGMASANVLDGSLESEFPRVLERMLALLDGTHEELKDEARAQHELWFASLLQEVGEFERMAERLVLALKRFPVMATRPRAVKQVTRQLSVAAMASESPLKAVRSFSEQLKSVSTGRDDHSRALRRLVGALWAEFALNLGRRDPGMGPVISAARAVVRNPGELRRDQILRLLLLRPPRILVRWIRRPASLGVPLVPAPFFDSLNGEAERVMVLLSLG